jgi:hypothetical protein
MDSKATFERTQSLRAFAIAQGASGIEIIKNPHTGKNFAKLKGVDITMRIAEKVGTDLNQDLSVSWFTPENGDASWMLHQTGTSNVVADLDFSADLNKV